jgi:hypothetical protein
MDGSPWPLQFQAVVTGILPKEVPSRFWKRNGPIIRVCTARSSILAAIPSLPTQMQTCGSHPAESLFRRQCITSCDSLALMECMPDIYRAIQHRTAVCGCRNSTRLRSSMELMLALPSRCTEGRQPDVILASYDRHFERPLIDLKTRASIEDLLRLRHLGGGGSSHTFCWSPNASSRLGCQPLNRRARKQTVVFTAAVRARSYQDYSH